MSAIACVSNEADSERYKRVLREIAENEEFREEAANLISDADRLVKQARGFCRKLNDKLDDTYKLWPGTKKYRFKEVKNCPRCKELFH